MVRALVGALGIASGARAQVRISEIHYNPPEGDDLEFVEIHNAGAAAVDLSGWTITEGVLFAFPAGTTLAPGAYLAVARSPADLVTAYPGLTDATMTGPFAGHLANEGETIVLSDASSTPQDSVAYDDDPPWDFLADGFGATLERACFSADGNAAESWRASSLSDEPNRSGGSPGGAGAAETCPPVPPARPRVYISEVMYHPVLEESLEDEHEFVEIHSEETSPVDLSGWKLGGGLRYEFRPGTFIAPGQYLAVARNMQQLLAVPGYGLDENSELLGDFQGTLDNGGDKVALIGADGQGVDSMSYDDDAPWPAGADALGAQEEWLADELLPLEQHRYRGISLERVSFDVPSGELANWAPSPVDGATPGKQNASARERPLPVVAETLVGAVGSADPLIRANEEVRVQVRFTPALPTGSVRLESFVDAIMTDDEEPITSVDLRDDGAAGDLVAADGVLSALLPGHPDNTVLRYRIIADRGAGPEVVSPRPSDPNAWNAYFVSPVINTRTRVYQVLVHPTDWGKMWSGIQGGRASGCRASTTWDARYPAVMIHDGQVIDVRLRYQGSRWNRTNGPNIASWPYPKPVGGPNPLRALSWRISLPRYNQLDGLGAITLNKLTQGCPGYNAGVGYKLFQAADVPGSNTRFIRFHVNGGYYHYMIELEHPDEDMMRRYHREMAKKHPDWPKEKPGHLFKSSGCNCDEGPYGWGDERVLNPTCNFSQEERYAATYDRNTHSWADYKEFAKLIDELQAARRSGNDAIRSYFLERFDYDLFLNYIVIMNWSVPFDDMFQNHFLYQRLSDGKWIVFPWDLDQNFGEWKSAQASIYMGEQGDPDNRSAWWNFMKDAFLKAFREEYDDRLLELNNTLLHPDNVARLVDAVTAEANPQEAAQAPAGIACSFPGRATTFKQFAVQRLTVVNTKVAGISLDAGTSQTVFQGALVQFDARNSKPDPGPDALYTWSNGMTGDYPTFVYDVPGVYDVVLTITVRGIEFKDSVKITVLEKPALVFEESGGRLVLEAESFHSNDRHGAENTWWEADGTFPSASGSNAMVARENQRQTFLQRYAGVAPELRFAVKFHTPGSYRIWLRAFVTTTQADSIYVGLDARERNQRFAQQFVVDAAGFTWSGDTRSDGPQVLEVLEPGLHLFSVWVRESAFVLDKIVLTQDMSFTPDGAGPAESPQGPPDGAGGFIRGDTNGDAKINVTDPVVLLLHLFQGAPLDCEDRADADDNGSLNLSDVLHILNYLFRAGAAPSPPFPAAGEDSTADDLACGPAA